MSGYIMITRPSDDAYDYALDLEAEGFKTFVEPMLKIEPKKFAKPDIGRYQALIFTSANAVRVFSERTSRRDIPVYAVGDHTRDEAFAVGFDDITTAQGTGDDLVEVIKANLSDKSRPLLHVCGVDVARPIDEMLAESQIQVERCVVYKAGLVDRLSDEAIARIKNNKIQAVTFFSKRTAENFVRLVGDAALLPYLHSIKTLCISTPVLECVQPFQWQDTYIAETPSREAMLALLKSVCS
jgi:uroporphyrinogen-III synthase